MNLPFPPHLPREEDPAQEVHYKTIITCSFAQRATPINDASLALTNDTLTGTCVSGGADGAADTPPSGVSVC